MARHQSPSDSYGIDPPAAPEELQPIDPPPITRYDVYLLTIPLVLLLAGLVGVATGVPLWRALAVGALAALALLADGLAVNPPR